MTKVLSFLEWHNKKIIEINKKLATPIYTYRLIAQFWNENKLVGGFYNQPFSIELINKLFTEQIDFIRSSLFAQITLDDYINDCIRNGTRNLLKWKPEIKKLYSL